MARVAFVGVGGRIVGGRITRDGEDGGEFRQRDHPAGGTSQIARTVAAADDDDAPSTSPSEECNELHFFDGVRGYEELGAGVESLCPSVMKI